MTKTAHRAALRVAVLVPCLVFLACAATAQDWPSWRGRLQTGVSNQTGLVSSWSVDGENLIWFQEYIARSTPAVFDGRVCANGRTGDGVEKKEIVTCWNAENGSKLWEHTFSVLNTTVPFNRVGWGSVTGDPETGHLYALNVDGHLHCFDREGEIVWSWRLSEDLGRASGYGGRTSTPIIDEDRLILSVIGSAWGSLGGPPRHRYVAFDKRTGRVRWASTPGGQPADMNTQSVPIVAVVNGQRLIIDGNADGHIYAIQARTGVKVWEFHLSQRGINVSPVIDGTTVYVSHSEENIDRGTMGRVVAIDATGRGDITST
ncbi:MAG: PQQ-binding-like beta-propeller repeat protein, partial [Acidobacteriota bacterium]|nr:PQQ-binding-like beta-propeller repeat protein [Acidobacteriota bacterium]